MLENINEHPCTVRAMLLVKVILIASWNEAVTVINFLWLEHLRGSNGASHGQVSYCRVSDGLSELGGSELVAI